MAHIRVAHFFEQADRLLPKWSGRSGAINGDLPRHLGQNLKRAFLNLGDGQIDRTRNMARLEGPLGHDVDEHESRVAQSREKLFTGNRAIGVMRVLS